MTIERTDNGRGPEDSTPRYTDEDVRRIVRATLEEALERLGIAVDDPIEVQKDFSHLREWRKATESVKTKGLVTLVAILVTGGVATFWLGLKGFFTS